MLDALARLGPVNQVLRLAVWEQLTTRQIAYVLGATEVAVCVRLHRARRRRGALLVPVTATPTLTPCPGEASS